MTPPRTAASDQAGSPLSDPYVRTNIAMLEAIEIAGNAGGQRMDSRISAALCRRGLLWQQPEGCWRLTAAGYRALEEWDTERSATRPRPEVPGA